MSMEIFKSMIHSQNDYHFMMKSPVNTKWSMTGRHFEEVIIKYKPHYLTGRHYDDVTILMKLSENMRQCLSKTDI